jgi:hypothetical protein
MNDTIHDQTFIKHCPLVDYSVKAAKNRSRFSDCKSCHTKARLSRKMYLDKYMHIF